jgi:hypothetical protein
MIRAASSATPAPDPAASTNDAHPSALLIPEDLGRRIVSTRSPEPLVSRCTRRKLSKPDRQFWAWGRATVVA